MRLPRGQSVETLTDPELNFQPLFFVDPGRKISLEFCVLLSDAVRVK